jgi:glycosyltransferase involved in cell wall biosynthesis
MRILIDDGLATLSQLSGIGHHGTNLWRHLSQLVQCDVTRYWFLKGVPRVARRFAYLGIANVQALDARYDVIHYQNYYVPYLGHKAKKVVTVHDLGAFVYPDTVPLVYRKYNQLTIENALNRADAVVCPSVFTKEEILTRFPQHRGKRIVVCSNGIRDVFWSSPASDVHLRNLGIDPYSYFLFVGVFTKRKNLNFLLNSFVKAKERGLLNEQTRLILVGKKAWDTGELAPLLRRDRGITVLGYVTDEQLVSLYGNCKALVFPSIYEGYGMPVIEAMSQHAPILLSGIPTNVALNRAHNTQMFVFDLGDEQQFLDHLEYIDKDAGEIRARLEYGDLSVYSYNNVAREHLSVYEHTVEDG